LGQFMAQAPHSMQRSLSTMAAFLFFRANTACGQTLMHMPQPVHRLESRRSVATFFKYFNSISSSLLLEFVNHPGQKQGTILANTPAAAAASITGTANRISF
jgi:hypothetical protein